MVEIERTPERMLTLLFWICYTLVCASENTTMKGVCASPLGFPAVSVGRDRPRGATTGPERGYHILAQRQLQPEPPLGRRPRLEIMHMALQMARCP